MILAHLLENTPLLYIGVSGFFLCGAAMLLSWPVFMLGLVTGKYEKLPAKKWKEQVW